MRFWDWNLHEICVFQGLIPAFSISLRALLMSPPFYFPPFISPLYDFYVQVVSKFNANVCSWNGKWCVRIVRSSDPPERRQISVHAMSSSMNVPRTTVTVVRNALSYHTALFARFCSQKSSPPLRRRKIRHTCVTNNHSVVASSGNESPDPNRQQTHYLTDFLQHQSLYLSLFGSKRR